MSTSTTLAIKLPQELWYHICKLVLREDLRSLRLVCKHLHSSATNALFSTIFLKFNLYSFKNMLTIANDQSLNSIVRHISYDGRAIRPDCDRLDRETWREIIGEDTGFYHEPIREYYMQLPEEEQENIFIAFQNYARGQEFLCKDGHEKAFLRHALAKLPGVKGISYHQPRIRRSRIFDFDFPSLSPTAQKILVEPSQYFSNGQDRFWNLVEATLESHPQLSILGGSDLPIEKWKKRSRGTASSITLPNDYTLDVDAILGGTSDGFEDDDSKNSNGNTVSDSSDDMDREPPDFELLSSLQALKLEFHALCEDEDETFDFGALLMQLPQLRSLRVSFDYLPLDGGAAATLRRTIPLQTHWKNLCKLSLEALLAAPDDLRDLLRKHSDTLRSLHLAHIWFTRPAKGNELQVSWIDFIEFLHEELSLDYVQFDGILSNQYDEAWVTYDCGRWSGVRASDEPAVRYNHDCLRYQIERYITHRGKVPFKAVRRSEKEIRTWKKYIILHWNSVDGSDGDGVGNEDDDEDDEEEEESRDDNFDDANHEFSSLNNYMAWRCGEDESWKFEQGLLV